MCGLLESARPQLFFSCSMGPTGKMEDKSSYREVSLVFFSTFEPISLPRDSYLQKSGIPMLFDPLNRQPLSFQLSTSALWKTFLAVSSCFRAT
jgi:hypothetical protein